MNTTVENARKNISDSDVLEMVVEPYIRSAHTQRPNGRESINGLIDSHEGNENNENDVWEVLQRWYPSLMGNTDARKSISNLINVLTVDRNTYGEYTDLTRHAFMQRLGNKFDELTEQRAPADVYQDLPLLVLAPSPELFREYIQGYYNFADASREIANATEESRKTLLALEKRVRSGEIPAQSLYQELQRLDQNLRNFLSTSMTLQKV